MDTTFKYRKSMLYVFLFSGFLLVSLRVSGSEKIFPASIRIDAPRDVLSQIIQSGVPVDMVGNSYAILYVTQDEYDDLSVRYRDRIVSGEVSFSVLQTFQEAQRNINGRNTYGDLVYHDYDSMLTELQLYQQQYPELCKLYEFGKSASGERNLLALKLSDNVDDEEDEPSVLLVGCIHGNEYPATEQVLYVINYLIENREDQDNSYLIDNTQLWFVPMLNPDGHEAQSRYNANGVDLNRDFPVSWDDPGNSGALNESETLSFVRNILEKHHIVASIDYHTYGKMYMYPWGHTSQKSADHEALKNLSDTLAKSVQYQSKSIASFFGPVSGGSVDYYYGSQGIFAIGVELGEYHFPPVEYIEPLCSSNLEPAKQLMWRVHGATVTGIVTQTGQSIVAEVFVEGIDDQEKLIRNPYTSDELFGRYYRMLEPGTYKFTFVLGKQSKVFEGVKVIEGEQTVLDVDFDEPDPNDPANESGCSCRQISSDNLPTSFFWTIFVLVICLVYIRGL